MSNYKQTDDIKIEEKQDKFRYVIYSIILFGLLLTFSSFLNIFFNTISLNEEYHSKKEIVVLNNTTGLMEKVNTSNVQKDTNKCLFEQNDNDIHFVLINQNDVYKNKKNNISYKCKDGKTNSIYQLNYGRESLLPFQLRRAN